MKKQRLIFVIVLSIVLLFTIGYAVFGQTVNITGTATAEGTYNMAATCSTTIPSEISSKVGTLETEHGVTSATCGGSGATTTFTSQLNYPGALKYFFITLENTGTIDAKFDPSSDLTSTGELCFDNDDSGTFESSECQSDNNYMITNPKTIFYNGTNYLDQDDENDMVLIEEYFMDSNGNVIIKPGYKVYFVFKTSVPTIIGGSIGGSFYMQKTTTMTFNMHQAN